MLGETNGNSGDNEVHEHVIVDGSIGKLRSPIDHFAYENIEQFVEKHNRYSNWEAALGSKIFLKLENASDIDGGLNRKRTLKRLARQASVSSLAAFRLSLLPEAGLSGRARRIHLLPPSGGIRILDLGKDATCGASSGTGRSRFSARTTHGEKRSMKVLILNQASYPDVVSTSQHASNLASELAPRGHEVTVIASRRAYDNPEALFPKRETWRGVTIQRVFCLGLGKKTKLRRAAGFASYLLTCCCTLLRAPRCDVVVALTSPPLISVLGALYARLRNSRFVFWVMDLNPDEAIAAGWLREQSVTARCLKLLLRYSVTRADRVVALDRFMQERIAAKGVPGTPGLR